MQNKKKPFFKRFLSAALVVLFLLSFIGGSYASGSLVLAADGKTSSDSTVDASSSATYFASSSSNEPDFTSYIQTIYNGEEYGLYSEVSDLVTTSDGRIWVGTYAGLYEYNGQEFELLSDIPSVKSVNCLFVDSKDRIWIGSNDSGVTIMSSNNEYENLQEEDGLKGNSIKAICADATGNYYVAAAGGLATLTHGKKWKVSNSLEPITDPIHMSADDRGNVVVVTDHGELYWLNQGKIIDSPIADVVSSNVVAATFSDDKLFVATATGDIYSFDYTGETPVYETTYSAPTAETINSFLTTSDGSTFVCADNGIWLIDRNGSISQFPSNQYSSSVDYAIQDYQGNVWFSSSRLGLLELSESPFTDLFYQIGNSSVANAVEKWNGNLYCGTDDGLVIMDGTTYAQVDNSISQALAGIRIRCIMADSKNNLWITTYGAGLYCVTEENGSYNIRNVAEEIGMSDAKMRQIMELSDGRIAVGGDYGLFILKDFAIDANFGIEDGLAYEKTLCLLEVDGIIYAGSDGGGITTIKDGKVTGTIAKSDGLSSDVILRLVQDPVNKGIFVIASNGINYISTEGKISYLDNFSYSNNYDMICNSNGTCLILGSAGIYIATIEDLFANEEKDYTLLDGKCGLEGSLTSNAWTCLDWESGILYLCCNDGVVSVKYGDYLGITHDYKILMNGVDADGNMFYLDEDNKLTIPSGISKLEMSVEVLNFTTYDPYVSYYLEGYEEKAVSVRLSQLDKISYSELPAGEYTFHINVYDNVDSDANSSMQFTLVKKAALKETFWFKLLAAMILAVVIIFLTWFISQFRSRQTMDQQQFEINNVNKQLQLAHETVLTIARTVDARNKTTNKHSYRVSEYSYAIAKRFGLAEDKCENIRQQALLHDIGKVAIPDSILNKPGALTKEEYEIVKSHVTKGAEILKDFTMVENASVGALYHHERYDGRGYCAGLKGAQIPIEARIIGIADAFDSMTSAQIYRKQLNMDQVISELQAGSGSQFDPILVTLLLALIKDGTINVTGYFDEETLL